MRLRSIYVHQRPEEQVRTAIEATSQDFAGSLRYGQYRFASQEDFLERCCRQDWIVETNEVLQSWVRPQDVLLSVGSGLGEHEVLLFRRGFDVTASDFVDGTCDEAKRLFPGFRAIHLDILSPPERPPCDAVLMLGGMDQYFDDATLGRVFEKTKRLLKPGGRLIFAIRHHDNACTRLIDYVLWPLVAALQNAKYRLQGRREVWVRKVHAYARSRQEVARLAERAGYAVRRIGHAGLGVEWSRLGIDVHLPRLYAGLRSVDRRRPCCNNVTLLELESR